MGNSSNAENDAARMHAAAQLARRNEHAQMMKKLEDDRKAAERAAAERRQEAEREEAEAVRKAEEAKAKRDQEFKEKMEKLKNADAAAKRKAAEEKERLDREQEEKMQKMRDAAAQRERDEVERIRKDKVRQRDESKRKVEAEIARCNTIIADSKNRKKDAKATADEEKVNLESMEKKITDFAKYKENALQVLDVDLKLKAKEKRFKENDGQIEAAIAKTGQTEENVGKFLKMTHQMLEATMVTAMDTNKMGSQIKTFDALINRECSDKLTIEEYSYDVVGLKPFVEIFKNNGRVNMRSLKCRDDKEFEEIKAVVKAGLAKQQEANKNGTAKDSAEGPGQAEDTKEKEEEEEEEELSPEALLKEWNLNKFWDSLKAEGWEDPLDWLEMEEGDLKDCGFKKGNIKRWTRAMDELKKGREDEDGPLIWKGKKVASLQKAEGDDGPLTAQALGVLRSVCTEAEGIEEWQEVEEELGKVVKEGLGSISPVLGDFFRNIHEGVEDASDLLKCIEKPSPKQMKAIEMAKKQPPPAKGGDDDEKEAGNGKQGDDGNSALRKGWKEGSECEVFSESMEKWCSAKIVAIHNHDDDGVEWLQVEYEGTSEETGTTKEVERSSLSIRPRFAVAKTDDLMKVQSYALKEAACSRLSVTEQMTERFQLNEQTKRARTVAVGVENCCKQVMLSQGTIRESLLLSRAICDLKPSKMESAECKALWDAVDKGAIRLMDSAIKMAKASGDFFGFFLRFQQSFLYFQGNKDKSLTVSLRGLRKDCSEFTAFREKFMVEVERLNKEAMDVIAKCVTQKSGAASFEANRAQLEKNKNMYLAAKAKHDQKAAELDGERDQLRADMAKLCARKARAEEECKLLDNTIEQNQGFVRQYQQALKELDRQIF